MPLADASEKSKKKKNKKPSAEPKHEPIPTVESSDDSDEDMDSDEPVVCNNTLIDNRFTTNSCRSANRRRRKQIFRHGIFAKSPKSCQMISTKSEVQQISRMSLCRC
jgi:hypothetical protein